MYIQTSIRRITVLYLLLFALVTVIVLMHRPADEAYGEYDDYTVMTASLLRDHNFTISDEDIVYAYELFPELSDGYQSWMYFTGLYAKNGDQLSWYSPTYSLFVIPFIGALKLMQLPAVYAYRLANLFVLVIAAFFVYKKAKLGDAYKFLAVLALTIHPSFTYLIWHGDIVLIYAMLIFSVVYWMNEEYQKAALYCAIAGTLNVTALAWGMVMILWYLARLYQSREKSESFLEVYFRHWKQILQYGSCYIIGLLPSLFNLYQIGSINISGSMFQDADALSTFNRFIAYFLDLNFGFLPYFFIIMMLDSVIFILMIIRKKASRYLPLYLGLCGVALGYSLMLHINCGMEGMARYNTWNSPFLILIAVYGVDELIDKRAAKAGMTVALSVGIFTTFFVTKEADKHNFGEMMPVASYILDHYPALYNPLHSTFNSRVNHVHGGYEYECPIIYYDEEKCARKILVDPASIGRVEEMLVGNYESMEWLSNQLSQVTKEEYISIGGKYALKEGVHVSSGELIHFTGENWNASKYMQYGISHNEEYFTWTDGKEVRFKPIALTDYMEGNNFYMNISIGGVYDEVQRVVIYVNNRTVYDQSLKAAENIRIPIEPDEVGLVNIVIILPNAKSPAEREGTSDYRLLGLQLWVVAFEKE